MVKGRNRQDDMLFDLVLHVIHDTLYVIRSKNTYYVCFDMFYVWCRITDDCATLTFLSRVAMR